MHAQLQRKPAPMRAGLLRGDAVEGEEERPLDTAAAFLAHVLGPIKSRAVLNRNGSVQSGCCGAAST